MWQGKGVDRKGRFVVKFSIQSKFWEKRSVDMENMNEFASELQEGDRLLSFDLTAGYHHVHLHSLMYDYFFFVAPARRTAA